MSKRTSKQPKVATTQTPSNKTQIITGLLQTELDGYGNDDLDTYTKKLESMGTNDLYEEALKRGLRPMGDNKLTTDTLIRLFKENQTKRQPQANIEKTGTLQDKANKILELMKVGR